MSKEFVTLPYACNPYLPGKEHVPDGEPHIFGDRLYVFGSHDEVGKNEYCTGSYVGWSAALDHLSEWRYEGVLLEKGEDPLDPDGTKNYYAPDVVQGNDGKFYLYYSICDSCILSVARADKPEGPYHFYGHVQDREGHVIGSSAGDYYQFDPALLNDNGRIWLYSGQGMPIEEVNGRKVMGAMVCELEEDMLTVKGTQRTITSNAYNRFDDNPFFEASSIRKYGNQYYFIYSPLPNTHNLCYAVSRYPDKDFAYKGVLVSNADIFEGDSARQIPLNYWGNNHGSLLKLNNDYYIFYHRNTNRCSFARQGCLERIIRNEDGSFKQAEMTSLGFAKKARPAKGSHAAYTACLLQKKDMPAFQPYTFYEYSDADPYIGEDETPVPYIANMTDGAMTGFRYLEFDGTEQEMILTARCRGEGTIEVFSNQKSIGYVPLFFLNKEAGKEMYVLHDKERGWKRFRAAFSMPAGRTELRLVYHGEGSADLLSIEIG